MKRATTVCGMLAICGLVLLGQARSQAQELRMPGAVMETRPGDLSSQAAHGTPAPSAESASVTPAGFMGGVAAGYGTGRLHIDNQTRYYIRIFVDGNYIGVIEPYGDMYRCAYVESYCVSAQAVFDDGTVYTWGPRTLYVSEDETSTWTLTY